jgi:hypothetical protein
MRVSSPPEPTPEEENAPPERLRDEEAMRAPAHEDPDVVRDDVGLDDERSVRRPPARPRGDE